MHVVRGVEALDVIAAVGRVVEVVEGIGETQDDH